MFVEFKSSPVAVGAFQGKRFSQRPLASVPNAIHPPQRIYQDSVGKWDFGTIENSIASSRFADIGTSFGADHCLYSTKNGSSQSGKKGVGDLPEGAAIDSSNIA